MKGYIINPLFVYLFNIVGKLNTLFIIGGIALCFCAFIGYIVSDGVTDTLEEEKKLFKTIKLMAFFGIALMVLSVFIPSQETMMYMLIAKYTTFENVEIGVDALKSAVDYVVEAVATMLGK